MKRMTRAGNWAVLCLALCCLGCGQPDVRDERAYLKWLDDPANGYAVREEGPDMTFTVKRIPNEWQAYLEAKELPDYTSAKDSLLRLFERDITFLLTIAPKDRTKNIMFRDITSLPEFKQRVNELNFNFGQYLKLQAGEKEIAPVLVSFENIYEAGGSRNMLIRFLDESDNKDFIHADKITLVWVDEVFWTGVHRFGFENKRK